MDDFIRYIAQLLSVHPYLGNLIAFTVAFAESLAIVGSVVPGSVTMTMIGSLIGASVLPFMSTFGFILAGAFSGDYLSYWIGRRYQDRLRKWSPFARYQEWLQAGEAFIQRHGGASIIIGRFVGPMRSMIPMVAGLLGMRRVHFILAAIPSVLLWAILYLIPGILLGAFSLELPHHLSPRFLTYGVSFILVILLFHHQDKLGRMIWRFLNHHRSTPSYTRLFGSSAPSLHVINCAAQTATCSLLFVWITYAAVTHTSLAQLNLPLHYFFQSLHTHWLDVLFVGTSTIFDDKLLLPLALLLVICLAIQRKMREATYLLSVMLIGAGCIFALKVGFALPRPQVIQAFVHTGSYPSGHTLLTCCFLYSLLTINWASLNRWQQILGRRLAQFIMLLVMLSRLYLGAHWLTDVLGGLFLGLSLVLTSSLIFRIPHNIIPKPHLNITLASTFLAGFVAVCIYGMTLMPAELAHLGTSTPQQTIDSNQWWQQTQRLPLVRYNRFGHPNSPFNIQAALPAAQIKSQLLAHGWVSHAPQVSIWARILHLVRDPSLRVLRLLPQLYLKHNPVLILSRQAADREIILKLWQSNTVLDANHLPILIGTLSENPVPIKLTLHFNDYSTRDLLNRSHFLTQVPTWQTKVIQVLTTKMPPSFQRLHWDGQIILLRLPPLSHPKLSQPAHE